MRAALQRFERAGEPSGGSDDPHSAGNGSLMRLAPVPMYSGSDAAGAVERAAEDFAHHTPGRHLSRRVPILRGAPGGGADADTTAAVYGQLAGAYYGASGIPEAWRGRVAMREPIRGLAVKPFRGGAAEE